MTDKYEGIFSRSYNMQYDRLLAW